VTYANVSLVRSIYAAWERGDWTSTEWAHPEIEFVMADGPSAGSWTGVAGMIEGWREFASAWENYSLKTDEIRELDDERVLVLHHRGGRGKTSGLELGQLSRGANVFHLHGGKVMKVTAYTDPEHAFADVGLTSKTDPA
jgi:ketosteroid isomerase-like protein